MTLDAPVKASAYEQFEARDSSQARAVRLLRQISSALSGPVPQPEKQPGLIARLFSEKPPATPVTQGLYLWGGVGRGKTWLMDSFYQQIPITGKTRLHYHHFIRILHQEMRKLPAHENTLEAVMRQFAVKYRLLCLDEFQVSDIGDAMLLQGALRGLFMNGVTLVATSNRHPDQLYKGGVLREQMLSSIKLLKEHAQVYHLNHDVDYRLQSKACLHKWFIMASNGEQNPELDKRFEQLSRGKIHSNARLEINHRIIKAHKISDTCGWFDFDHLCNGPRAVSDYIQLAERFSSLIISSVPALHEALESAARRFMNLVDELYDRRIQLVLSAEVPLEQLYQGEALSFEYQRTLSRLHEMQSPAYTDLDPV